ncbi:hypothetical protein EDF38_1549 [Frigoribacterium sp. PhB160]|jgi:hypothetical protein|uniref:hypothetical protein n=1 Tax=Frigoribacterium sp. PhB160 TaxID=2485192 RepID=UPI000F47C5E6|nr:hypothetical protein [Frigoribacterium sp. PhB160]ROS62438.1 hypothetical protein EDF38_1549 [Frigoribacterium sp. PhB160]
MGTEHHGDATEHTHHEHDEDGVHVTTDETRSTSSEKDGAYVDSDIPEDGSTAGGPHDGEADGKFTDSDIPGDR